jgi:hypothetical protein
VIQEMAGRGLISEDELDALHWARRVRNHVTHRIGNFMAKPAGIRKKQMDAMRKGIEILSGVTAKKE